MNTFFIVISLIGAAVVIGLAVALVVWLIRVRRFRPTEDKQIGKKKQKIKNVFRTAKKTWKRRASLTSPGATTFIPGCTAGSGKQAIAGFTTRERPSST